MGSGAGRLRVLYLSNVLSIHDYRFLTSLVQNGYEVYLLTFKESIPGNIRALSGLTIIHKPLFHKEATTDGRQSDEVLPRKTNIATRPYSIGRRIVDRLQDKIGLNIIETVSVLLAPWRAYQTRKIIRELHPDILHTVWIPAAGLIGALSRFHPVLLMPLASDVLILPHKSCLWRWLTRFVLRRADMITCDSEVVRQAIVEQSNFPEDKIVVFPRGVDLRLFHPDPKLREKTREMLGWQKDKIIIMTRSFAPVYGIEYFLRSLPKVLEEVPNAKALLIGTGPLEMSFRTIVKELGVDSAVRFQGMVANKELPAYLNAADLYVSSSLSDGTSVSLLEAMACGLPVVVTDVPSILEWVKDGVNGLVCPRRDSVSLADAIITLLQDEQMAAKMGEKNLAIAKQRADWDKNFKLLEGMYTKLTKLQNGD